MAQIKRNGSNVTFINFEAKKFYKLVTNLDKSLILLHSENCDGVIMTQEAYATIRQHMTKSDLVTHLGTPIDPSSASYLCETIVTLADVMSNVGQQLSNK